jgi:hypothetical protein
VTAAALVAELRARGVTLRPEGGALKVRPVSKLTPDELKALRQHKAEVLALLAKVATLELDPSTVREALGDQPDPHDVAALQHDVAEAVHALEAEIATGALRPGVRLVRGRPLADWLPLDEVARLLRRSQEAS